MKKKGRPRRRLLHTSDLHLESLDDKNCDDFKALMVTARQTEPDLVVIAGDLFDHHRIKDNLISFVAGELRSLQTAVVILPGNHDCLIPQSAYQRSWLWEDYSNIRIFKQLEGEVLILPDLGISLWGRPVPSYDEDIFPLAGIPQPEANGWWNIAVAHGYYVGDEPSSLRSYNITHREIVRSGWDYIALGHLNLFQCICSEPVTAYYSGSPSISGGVAIVDLFEETGIQVSHYSLTTGRIL